MPYESAVRIDDMAQILLIVGVEVLNYGIAQHN